MLDLKLEDIDGILVRYNVALEKEMTPDEAAEELYPKDELIYPIAKAIYEGEEDDVVDALKAAIDAGKKPIDLTNDALMVGMGVVSQLSTSPTGSENHLSPLRFQTFNRKYFEIEMKLNDFSIQLVKYCSYMMKVLFSSRTL